MTPAQRRKQSRENGRLSQGPITDDGKKISRMNALKHGLTAVTLILPDENPDQIQEQADDLYDALQPETRDEELLVDQLALNALRLERLAKAETAIVAEQARTAVHQWDQAERIKLLEATRLLRKDPARAIIELEGFGAGVDWLLGRWETLQIAFDTYDCWNNLALIKEAVRLRGHNPDRLHEEPFDAYDFALQAVSCGVDHKETTAAAAFLEVQRPPDWTGRFGSSEYEIDEAVELVRERIKTEIAALKERARYFEQAEAGSRSGAEARAMVPASTPQNLLLFRYIRTTESAFDRTLKTLAKLQSERQKAAEIEAENQRQAASPNEPRVRGRADTKRIHPGSYVTLNGTRYVVDDTGDGHLMLSPAPIPAPTAFPGAVSTPWTGV